MSFFRCPVCCELLKDNIGSLKCKSGHSFDRAKSGYFNLLLTNAKRHGDDRIMVRARSAFLDLGYYVPLLDGVSDILVKHFNNGIILDAGCGEGYYTRGISDKFKLSGVIADIIAIDISKNAVDIAAKRHGASEYAVASVYDLPLNDSSVDVVLNIFAPFCLSEYKRVLKKDGIIVYVIPLERHLFGLKKQIYDNPYFNEVKPYETEELTLFDTHDIKYTMNLNSNEDIINLFMMTPYYYTTGEADQMKIKNTASLETEAEFRIIIYKRI
jgi:23S rRNA (guanine745-N1)-methyltransferase